VDAVALGLLFTACDASAPLELSGRGGVLWVAAVLVWGAAGSRRPRSVIQGIVLLCAAWGALLVQRAEILLGLAVVTGAIAIRVRPACLQFWFVALLTTTYLTTGPAGFLTAGSSPDRAWPLLCPGRVGLGLWLGGSGLILVSCGLALFVWSARGGARQVLLGLCMVAVALGAREVVGTSWAGANGMASHVGPLLVRVVLWTSYWQYCVFNAGSARHHLSILAGLTLSALAWLLGAQDPFSFSWQLLGKRVLVVTDGGANTNRPDLRELTDLQGAMFGVLVDTMRSRGANVCAVSPEIAIAELETADAVIAINVSSLMDQDGGRLLGFVRRGGALVVCVDHTNVFGSAACWNRVLAEAGCEFLYDSAVPLGQHWYAAFQWSDMPLGSCRGSVSPGIGCSIAVSSEWRPVARGLTILQDHWMPGNVMGGHLGGYIWDSTEAVGPCVVSATRWYGKGRIVVHGDTGVWQNGPLGNDAGFAVDRLAGEGSDRSCIGMAVVTIIAAIASLSRRKGAPLAASIIAGLALAACCGSRTPTTADVTLLNEGLPLPGEDGVECGAAPACFQACGLSVSKRASGGSTAIAFLSLRGRSGEAQLLDTCLRLARDGSLGILLVSEEGWIAVSGELHELGLQRVHRIPMDDASTIEGMLDAHVLECDAAWHCIATADAGPVIAARELGAGTLVVVGDPLFFSSAEWRSHPRGINGRLCVLKAIMSEGQR